VTATAPARAERTDLSPECRLTECGYCPGPLDVRVPGDSPEARPVLHLPCACSCHRLRATSRKGTP
jgi:hypothetical protein